MPGSPIDVRVRNERVLSRLLSSAFSSPSVNLHSLSRMSFLLVGGGCVPYRLADGHGLAVVVSG